MADVSAERDPVSDLGLPARRPLRVLPWWVVPIGLAAVAVATVVTLEWLLPIAGRNPSLRIDAIKTGLSVGAGAGGATALLLALRRQWLFERAQAHAEEVARATQMHAEQVARQDNSDAIERRVTDLYSRAVEQIGHGSAAVRLGGLYSLERLAGAHPEHRQTVVDVICAYLRMPFRYPPVTHPVIDLFAGASIYTPVIGVIDPEAQSETSQELQVRLAAQRMLTRHLANYTANKGSPTAQEPSGDFWGQLRIDLNGASLYGCDFSGCQLRDADFRNVNFFQETHFDQARFTGQAQFSDATFCRNSSFSDATFEQDAWFADAVFNGNAEFKRVTFTGETRFDDAKFGGEAHFTASIFSGIARFDDAQFRMNSWIDDATFGTSVWFGGTRFIRGCEFENTQFAYYKCHSSWPAGWRLEPLTHTMAKLTRDKPAFLGIARYHNPGEYLIAAGNRNGNPPA